MAIESVSIPDPARRANDGPQYNKLEADPEIMKQHRLPRKTSAFGCLAQLFLLPLLIGPCAAVLLIDADPVQAATLELRDDLGICNTAQPVETPLPYRDRVLVLDFSESMWAHPGDGHHRFQVLLEKLAQVLQSSAVPWNSLERTGISYFGGDTADACDNVTVVARIGDLRGHPGETVGRIMERLKTLRPKGPTPLRMAIEQARQQLAGSRNPQIVIITDGTEEACPRPDDFCRDIHGLLEDRVLTFDLVTYQAASTARRELEQCLQDHPQAKVVSTNTPQGLGQAITDVFALRYRYAGFHFSVRKNDNPDEMVDLPSSLYPQVVLKRTLQSRGWSRQPVVDERMLDKHLSLPEGNYDIAVTVAGRSLQDDFDLRLARSGHPPPRCAEARLLISPSRLQLRLEAAPEQIRDPTRVTWTVRSQTGDVYTPQNGTSSQLTVYPGAYEISASFAGETVSVRQTVGLETTERVVLRLPPPQDATILVQGRLTAPPGIDFPAGVARDVSLRLVRRDAGQRFDIDGGANDLRTNVRAGDYTATASWYDISQDARPFTATPGQTVNVGFDICSSTVEATLVDPDGRRIASNEVSWSLQSSFHGISHTGRGGSFNVAVPPGLYRLVVRYRNVEQETALDVRKDKRTKLQVIFRG